MSSPETSRTPERGLATAVVVGVVAAVVVVAGLVWFFFIRDTAPERFSLEDALGDVDVDPQPEEPLDSIEGTWVVSPDAGPSGSSSEAGYRVEEELASVGDKTVVGRTSDVVGAVTLEGTQVTEVSVTVDMQSVATDSSQRDGRYRAALEVDRFPTSKFVLTEPIELGELPDPGEHISVVATGDLTVHGVTRQVEATLDATVSGSTLVVVGSIPVTFADYEIQKPSAAIVLSLDDQGVIEFQLYLTKD